jgi:hypothetical protein
MAVDLMAVVVQHLRTALPELRAVGGSADLDAALEGAVALPAAFVLPLLEQARPLKLLGLAAQRVTVTFGVLHVLSNRRDARGAAALTDLHTHRRALRAALLGWVPDAETGEPVTFEGGRLMRLDDEGRLWWMDEFKAHQDERQPMN